MDHLKFRVWDEETEEYIDPDHNRMELEPGGNIFIFFEPICKVANHPDRFVVERCTGLKIDGIDLFEGDIFRIYYGDDGDYLQYTVIWKDGGFTFYRESEFPDYVAFSTHSRLAEVLGHSEIVGNIHEGV